MRYSGKQKLCVPPSHVWLLASDLFTVYVAVSVVRGQETRKGAVRGRKRKKCGEYRMHVI